MNDELQKFPVPQASLPNHNAEVLDLERDRMAFGDAQYLQSIWIDLGAASVYLLLCPS